MGGCMPKKSKYVDADDETRPKKKTRQESARTRNTCENHPLQEEPKVVYRRPPQNEEFRVCVAGHSQTYVNIVADRLEAIIRPLRDRWKIVIRRKRTGHVLPDDFYENADRVVLVATGSQRLLLISEMEESQLGVAYMKANHEKLNMFLVLVAHEGSSQLDNQLYSEQLNNVLKSQPAVSNFAKNKRFISLGFTHERDKLAFSPVQAQALRDWINPACVNERSVDPVQTQQHQQQHQRPQQHQRIHQPYQQQHSGVVQQRANAKRNENHPAGGAPHEAKRRRQDQHHGKRKQPQINQQLPTESKGKEELHDINENRVMNNLPATASPEKQTKDARYSSEIKKKNVLRICIAGHSTPYVSLVTNRVETMLEKWKPKRDVVIITRNTSTIIDENFYGNTDRVILVATGSQRLLLVSNVEDSQLGGAYRKALKENVNIFIVLVGHHGSTDLPDTEPYAPALQKNLRGQKEVYEIIQQNKFISMAYIYDKDNLKFNKAQSEILYEWLATGQSPAKPTPKAAVAIQNIQNTDKSEKQKEMMQRETVTSEVSKEQRQSGEGLSRVEASRTSLPPKTKRKGQLGKVCIAGTVNNTVAKVLLKIQELIDSQSLQITVIHKEIKATHVDEDFYKKSDGVLLVATSSEQLLILEDADSYLGVAYRRARRNNATIYLVLVCAEAGESFEGLVAPKLQTFLQGQKLIDQLNKRKRFISVGQNEDNLVFNKEQKEAITEWMAGETK